MLLTNSKIYTYASDLIANFTSNCDLKLPVAVNFYLIKNKNELIRLAQEIDQMKKMILEKYGVLNEERQEYVIKEDKSTIAVKEMNELFNLEQDVKIYTVPLSLFKSSDMLTLQQMEALMFMIEE